MKRVICTVAMILGLGWATFAQTTQPTTQPAAPADRALRQLVSPSTISPQVLQPIKEPPATDATSGKGAVSPDAHPQNLIREGEIIPDRLGRLTRGADGQMEFTFESDGKTMQDPPMVILPNLMLMAMEAAVSSSNRDLKFRITGMVTEYKGRNHILLEKVVVVPESKQQL